MTSVFTLQQSVDQPPDELRTAIADGKVVPIIGPYFSSLVHKKDQRGSYLPNPREMIEALLLQESITEPMRATIRDYLERGDEHTAAQKLHHAMGPDLYYQLRSIIEPDGIKTEDLRSPAHRFLNMLECRRIITTNYDRLLEYLTAPVREVVTGADFHAIRFFVDKPQKRLLFKLHGDITRPETICFNAHQQAALYQMLSSPSDEVQHVQSFLKAIFTQNTLLFLGFMFREDAADMQLLAFVTSFGKLPQQHYALVPDDHKYKLVQTRITQETGVKFLKYREDDHHQGNDQRAISFFLSMLNTSKTDKPQRGESWRRPFGEGEKERKAYLDLQLEREQQSRSVRFLTPQLTNAIATPEYLSSVQKEKGQPEDVNYRASMEARQNNLITRLKHHDIEVRCLFFKDELDKEFARRSATPEFLQASIERYRMVLELAEETALEIRLQPTMTEAHWREREASYAVIYGTVPDGTYDPDVTIAVAPQAQKDFHEPHMIEINTPDVIRKAYQFGQLWATAWSTKDSLRYIERMIDEA